METPPPRAAGADGRSAGDLAATFAYNPALDGMRVICIYIILAGHMHAIHASNVAVDVFFVLSGFLITALLLAERSRTGTVSISRFLVRRAFRLMPAMWVYLLVGLAVTVAFKWNDVPLRNDYLGSALSAFFNVNNWYKVLHPAAGGRWLAHVWSLSLEEQFYLLWPGLFVLVTRSERLRPHLGRILLAMILVAAVWTFGVASRGAPHSRIYLALDTHVAPLLIGCLTAVWRDGRLRALARDEDLAVTADDREPGSRRRAARSAGAGRSGAGGSGAGGSAAVRAAAVSRWRAGQTIATLGPVAAIGLVLFAFLGPNKDALRVNWLDHAAYLPSAALAAIVILSADLRREASWVRFVGHPTMAFLGKITFSIYLWHYPVISAANGQLVPRIGLWPSVVVAAALSTFVAYFSNRFIEKPAQRARPAWADTPRGPARGAAVPAARPIPEPEHLPPPATDESSEDTAWLTFGARRPVRPARQDRWDRWEEEPGPYGPGAWGPDDDGGRDDDGWHEPEWDRGQSADSGRHGQDGGARPPDGAGWGEWYPSRGGHPAAARYSDGYDEPFDPYPQSDPHPPAGRYAADDGYRPIDEPDPIDEHGASNGYRPSAPYPPYGDEASYEHGYASGNSYAPGNAYAPTDDYTSSNAYSANNAYSSRDASSRDAYASSDTHAPSDGYGPRSARPPAGVHASDQARGGDGQARNGGYASGGAYATEDRGRYVAGDGMVGDPYPDQERPAAGQGWDVPWSGAAPGARAADWRVDTGMRDQGAGSARAYWDAGGGVRVDAGDIWVDEGYARSWNDRDPVTGPSRPPADPAYVDETYPGELVRDALPGGYSGGAGHSGWEPVPGRDAHARAGWPPADDGWSGRGGDY